MKRLNLLISTLILLFEINAQSIERQFVGTGGDYIEANNVQLSQSIGEAFTASFLQGQNHLTQGFQQGEFQQIVLPLELLLLTAKRLNPEEVNLSWKILETATNESLVLQRKWKGKDFVDRHVFSSEEQTVFSFLDQNNAVKETYYRLKMKSLGGNISYSEIRAVEGTPLLQLASIFPNPITSESVLALEKDARYSFSMLQITVFDATGKVYFSKTISNDSAEIKLHELQKLPTGTYHLQVQFDQGNTEIIPFSKI